MFEEQYGIRISNGCRQQSFQVIGRARHYDLQTRCAEKQSLNALRVIQTSADPGSVGSADDDGTCIAVVGTVADLSRFIDNLVNCRMDEVGKLYLGYRS